MRKFLVLMLSVAALNLVLVKAASAYPLGQYYGVSELKGLCKKNRGQWAGPGSGLPGYYSCGKVCTAGGDWCTVGCNGVVCWGDCPNCPARMMGSRREIAQKILTGGGRDYSISRRIWRCDPNCACSSWIGCPCCIGPSPGGGRVRPGDGLGHGGTRFSPTTRCRFSVAFCLPLKK